MKVGVLFPQTELGDDPFAIRDYARAVADLGFSHMVTYEHVLGAVRERLPKDYAPYTIEHNFQEPLTMFSHLCGITPKLEWATAVLVLPQRQAPLVAKQAATLDLLSGGRFRLGVGIGWNFMESQALGQDFKSRARRFEEQIDLMRRLWTQPEVTFQGEFHQVEQCGIRPLPERPIPIWIGGTAEAALKRAARIADGFFPLRPLEGGWISTFERMKEWRAEAGLSWDGFGIEARVDEARDVAGWRDLGASHIYVNTLGRGWSGLAEHLKGLQEVGGAVLRA